MSITKFPTNKGISTSDFSTNIGISHFREIENIHKNKSAYIHLHFYKKPNKISDEIGTYENQLKK